MINKLIFSVTFASTGKQIKGEHSFTEGMTVITGQNEQGKSLRIEMIRYAFFGTKALRAPLDAYKDLSTCLEIQVKGKTYKLRRTRQEASITDENDKVLVRGARPVTDYVEQKILGYTMDVFDMTNACLQGQVENLMSKTPAERKRLVDKTIGLDVIDDVEKIVTETLSEFRGKIKALEEDVVEDLVPPILPEDYLNSSELAEEISTRKINRVEYTSLIKQQEALVKPQPVAPPEEEREYNKSTLEDLRNFDETRTRLGNLLAEDGKIRQKIQALEGTFKEVPESKRNFKARHAAYSQWLEVDRWQQIKDKIIETPETCKEALDQWRAYEEDQELLKDKNRAQAQLQKLNEETKIHCPSCGHEWSDNDELIRDLDKRLRQIKYQGLPQPTKSLSYWNNQLSLMKVLGDLGPKPEPDLIREPLENIHADEQALSRSRNLDELRSQVLSDEAKASNEKQLVDVTNKIQGLEKYLKELQEFTAYLQKLQAYNSVFDALQLNINQFTETHSLDFDTDILEEQLQRALSYEKELHTYETLKIRSEAARKKLEAVKAQMQDWENAKAGLRLIKPAVKTYLIPSLSRASSVLVNQMTSGKRTKVEVDENFNVKVDGQDVEELSGSAKAVTNLALRFGLGAVLTHGVFSVFLGDEIDAAMDAERVAATAECVKNLKSNIKQIILVSHRNPESDHKVEL